jgi:VCBS repeat-containing protein
MVYVDGNLRYTSPVLGASDPGINLNIDVTGGTTLRLAVDNGNGASDFDWSHWANARLEGGTIPLTIAENASNGSVVGSVSSVDIDSVDNASYTLTNDAGGRFAINSATGQITVADGTLLNFEAATSHTVVVRATDLGGLFFDKTLTLGVSNVNEAPAAVANTATAVEAGGIANATAGTNPTGNVLTNDTDVDAGETKAVNGVVAGTSASASGSVGMDVAGAYGTINIGADGTFSYVVNNISTAVQALRTSADTLSDVFTYTMTDSGGLMSTAQMTVTIHGANDEQVITTNGGITVAENSTGNVIATAMLQTTDVDDTAVNLTYTLASAVTNGTLRLTGVALGNGSTFTQADINSGLVTYDHDGTENFADAFSFSVDDGTGTTSTGTFSITITPVNDNDPAITSDGAGATASISIAENTTAVTTVTATDSDLPAQTLTYSISGADAGLFTINGSSGQLSFATARDFETRADANADGVYVVTLEVSDGTRTDTQTISVTIFDINENGVSAVNDSDSSTNTIAENSTIGTTVGITGAASDSDGTDLVTYSLTDDAGGRFTIDANTGVVTVAGAIDREDAAAYNITIRATSTDMSFTTLTVAISVTDVNESPVSTPVDANATVNSVTENSANGTLVGIAASATDSDATTNAVTYDLIDDAGGRFAINATTGDVTVTDGTLLNFESSASHNITVRATSSDLSTATQVMTIILIDVNEMPVTVTDTATAVEAGGSSNGTAGTNPTGNVLMNDTDVDAGDTKTVGGVVAGTSASASGSVGVSVSGSFGSINIAANGSYTYTVNNNNAAVQALRTSSDTLTDVFTYTMADSGGLTSTTQITLTIQGANDEQVIATNVGTTVAENSTGNAITAAMLQTTDVDDVAASLTYTLTSAVTRGTLRLNGVTLTNGNTFTQADVNSGLVTYDHDGTENFTDAFSFSVDDGTGTTSTATFNVTITPVNDNDPTITSDGAGATASISIAENTTVVTTVTATDSDLPAETLTYSISGTDASFFTIGSSSGVLSFAAGRNFESPMDANSDGIYVVTVQVSDGTRTDTQTISVTITDADEFNVGAVTDNDVTSNTVAENSAIGAAVGLTVSATDADGTTNTITYSLVNDDGGRFAIDASTGIVTVAGAIDRETDGATRSITVRATSADTSYTDQLFTIAISDVNEAAVTTPVDNNATINSVAENASNGTVVGITALASDADATTNGITYSLTDDAGGRFTINSSTGVVTVADGSLLDYETTTSHNITVRATSADLSTADQSFAISITDVNEGAVSAVADSDASADTIVENSAVGTLVGITALATDPDGTDVVTYSLTNNAGGRFAIDANTGVVTVAGAIDREAAASYTITIRATSTDASFTTQTFTISIVDVNEFATGAVTDTNASLDSVTENASVGTTVGMTAQATDADATTNTITYSLQNDDGGRFAINSGTGVITVAGAIDFEADGASRTVTVRATSVDGSFTDQSFTISIVDANEFPVIVPADTDTTSNSVDEYVVIGTAVGITASASDADATTNTVTYSLFDSDGGNFAIDVNTGVVTTAALLNRETLGATRSITVRATSADGSHADQVFTIAINDLDEFDVTASIDANNGSNEVYENASTGTSTGIVASSEDSDATNNGVTYSLTDDAGGRFAIDSTTGIITVAGAIDRETDGASLNVTVRATSADGSMADRTFTINVLDVSEYSVTSPVDSDSSSNSVDENAAIGTIVNITAQSQDADATTNAITYSLIVDDGGRFTIDSNLGVVTVAGSIDRETHGPSRTIIVRATSVDGSTADTSFTIAINDLDEFDVSASADSDPGLNQVSEHATIGAGTGLTAIAVDDDATNNGVLYSLANDAGGRFAIDANSGVVTLVGVVDRETDGPSLSITVRATSTDGSTSDTNYSISILDEDDFDVTAVADANNGSNEIDENSAVGATVNLTGFAEDLDATTNAITYSLTDNDGGRFAIDASTGVVTVAGAIDRETDGPTRSITIRATSADGSIAEQTFTIDINDVNESTVTAPVDINAAVNQVDENSTIGTIVGITVNSTDPDSTTNSVTYSLVNNDGGRFAVDANSGVVTVAGAIDRETDGPSRTIIVRATSADGSTADSTLTISVNDVDEFDVTAVADGNNGSNEVDENAAIGATVNLTAFAEDHDATTNTVTYTLIDNDGGRFSIDAVTGVVTVAGAIDRETDGPIRSITVRATSVDGSTADSSFSIAVNDVDEFDVTAVIDGNNGNNEIDENAAVGTLTGVVAYAEDLDSTTNSITYSLTNNDGGRFAIDAVSGVVTVAGSIDREADGATRSIIVRATSADGSTADSTFTIAVNDVNEFSVTAPADGNNGSNVIDENSAVGTTVNLTAFAEDLDATTNAITYSLTDNDGGRFSIDAVTGVVTVAGAIDREADGATRTIVVRATSVDGSTADSTLTIAVNDVDEFNVTAVVDGNNGSNEILENSAIGATVNLTAFAEDLDATTNAITYSLSDNDGGRFAINSVTGVVTVAGAINRETDGPARSITIRATSADASFTEQTFAIAILDADEFNVSVPVDADALTNAVTENATNGTVVGVTMSAFDGDATFNGITYSLLNDAGGRFAIDGSTGIVTVANGSLLDRELAILHTIVVQAASDDGSFSTLSVNIALIDVDEFDITPAVDVNATANLVAELALQGTVTGITISASDADATTNAITYSLDDNAGGRFQINASTGVITVGLTPLNFEFASTYSVTARATSADGSAATITVTIGLADVNEFPISAITDTNVASNTVAENAVNGSIIGITAFASDADGTDIVTYSLDNTAGGRFTIDVNTGIITVADGTLLNFEAATSHSVIVRATSTDGSSTTLTISINLIDVNEFSITPIADSNSATNAVNENAAIGTLVGFTANAMDQDGTTNLITYTLDDNAGGRFTINASTGAVSVANGGLLDRETAASHSIIVRATSADLSFVTQTVSISINDVNEFATSAVTDTDTNTEVVFENAASGTVVGLTAFAFDSDSTSNAIVYSFDSNAGGRFAVDANTGIVTVANGTLLNYEAQTSHSVTVRATSADGSFSVRAYTIQLSDVDEFDVGAISDSNPAANAVNENSAAGTLVGITGSAFDADGTNNTITWTLDDNAGGRFAIDSGTGIVTVANGGLLDRETSGAHTIIARATSSDSSFTTRSFAITVNDLNDTAPIITPAQQYSVSERASVGTIVGNVVATDADSVGTNQNWSIVGGNSDGIFSINAATGRLSVSNVGNLNFERTSTYTLLVATTDGVNTSLMETVVISVVDENEAPVFGPSPGIILDENLANNTVIGQVFAADVDAADQLTYSLSSSVPVSAFSIDAITGEISVRDSSLLNFEALRTITLTVQVTDRAGLTDSMTTAVTLRDVNEVPVTINLAGGLVTENSVAGVFVGTVSGIDPDAGDQLTYSFLDSASGRFVVNSGTGAITVAAGAGLNFEAAASHTTVVRATDRAGLFFDQTFTINVRDINEAPIAFADVFYTFQLTKLDLTSLIGVLGNDYDDDGDTLTAQLISGVGHGTLLLRTDGSFLYDPVDVFTGTVTFTYRVSDGAAFSNSVTVRIDVLPTVNPGGGGSGNGDGDGTGGGTGGDGGTGNGTDPGTAIVPPGLGSGTNSSETTVETTSIEKAAGENSDNSFEDALDATNETPVLSLGTAQILTTIVDTGLSGRTDIDYRPDAGPQNVVQGPVSAVWGNSTIEALPFDALVRAIELRVEPQVVSHAEVDHRFAGFTTGDLVVGTSAFVSTSVSVGIMVWVLRGGSLLTAFMSATPVWTAFDPLPILVNRGNGGPKEDDTLLSLVKGLKK